MPISCRWSWPCAASSDGVLLNAVGIAVRDLLLLSARVWGSGVGTRRTPAGRAVVAGGWLLSHADNGFRRGAVRLRCAQDLYHRIHSVRRGRRSRHALGAKYKAATGDVPPEPDWYQTSHGTSWGATSSGVLVSTASSRHCRRRSAPTASQSSSSSVAEAVRERRWWRRRWWRGGGGSW